MKRLISVLVLMIMIMSVSFTVFAADEEIADFSKAKFEFVYTSRRNVHIKITGVTLNREKMSISILEEFKRKKESRNKDKNIWKVEN